MAPPSTPPPRMTPSPSPSFPSSPSSRAPSMIDDPTLSDVSSLDDEDYELIEGRTPSANYASANLSASRSWMSDSVPPGSPRSNNASVTASSTQMGRSTEPSRDRRESGETALDQSWAASDDQGAVALGQTSADHDVDTPISSTHHLIQPGRAAVPSTSTMASNAGGSGGSTVSTWILPDPTSPENSINLGHAQQCSTPSVVPASKSNSEQRSSLEGFGGVPGVDPVWRRTLGASWEKTLDSELSSSEPQLGHGWKGRPEAGVHKQGDIAVGEKQAAAFPSTSTEPLEPDWAQKTKAWLQISGSGPMSPSGEAPKTQEEVRETDCNLRGLVRKGSTAARAHMKTAFPNNVPYGMLLHWIVAALCGFMGALVLLHPGLPTETIRAAISFPPLAPLASFNIARGPFSPLSANSAQVTFASQTSQTCQPIETAALSAISSPSSSELSILDNQTMLSSQKGVGSSVLSATDEDEALFSSYASQELSEGSAPISEWISATSQAAWHTLKISGGATMVALYAEWYYWERKLKALWFEVMEPVLKQIQHELEAVISTLGTDLWDATALASAYGQAMSACAAEKAHVVMRHSEAAHKATTKQVELLYEAYLKDQLFENKQRASQHFDKAKKTARHLRTAGGEHAVHFYQSAKGRLDDWSRDAAKVAEVGKERWSDLSIPSGVSTRARQVLLSAERGKNALLEAVEARHTAVGAARGSRSIRSGNARKASTKQSEGRSQNGQKRAHIEHADLFREAAAPLRKASQQARDTVHAQLKRAGKGSDAAKKKVKKGLSSLDDQWRRATKKATAGKPRRPHLRG